MGRWEQWGQARDGYTWRHVTRDTWHGSMGALHSQEQQQHHGHGKQQQGLVGIVLKTRPRLSSPRPVFWHSPQLLLWLLWRPGAWLWPAPQLSSPPGIWVVAGGHKRGKIDPSVKTIAKVIRLSILGPHEWVVNEWVIMNHQIALFWTTATCFSPSPELIWSDGQMVTGGLLSMFHKSIFVLKSEQCCTVSVVINYHWGLYYAAFKLKSKSSINC